MSLSNDSRIALQKTRLLGLYRYILTIFSLKSPPIPYPFYQLNIQTNFPWFELKVPPPPPPPLSPLNVLIHALSYYIRHYIIKMYMLCMHLLLKIDFQKNFVAKSLFLEIIKYDDVNFAIFENVDLYVWWNSKQKHTGKLLLYRGFS